MSSRLRRLLRPIPYVFSDWIGLRIARIWSGKLRRELSEKVTDGFLDLLLDGMDLAFCLCKGYRENIKDFEGRYVFRTTGGDIAGSALFRDGDMKTPKDAVEDWDVRITFTDAAALRSFLFSRDQDILGSLLKNEVELDGNINYIYKFGFMVRDLTRRLGFE